MNDVFGDRAAGFPDRELVFEWRPPHRQYRKSTAHLATLWVVAALALIALAFIFWPLLRDGYTGSFQFAARWKALILSDQMMMAAVPLVKILAYFMVAGLLSWVQYQMRRSRLYLSGSTLSQRSGLPLWLGNLLRQNWALSLDDFRSGRLAFTPSALGQGYSPLARYVLRCKAAQGKTHRLIGPRHLVPADWFLIGQEAREPLRIPGASFWRMHDPWATPQGRAALEGAFDQLPLVAGLRAQGVALPPFSSARHPGLGEGGFDLMAYPRMKAVVLTFFGLLASAGLGYHFMRHQHYFESPPLWTWVAFGTCCALATWMWLATQPQPPGEPSLKPTQGVLALLPGVGAALLAPSALLALNQVLIPAQSVTVTVRHAPLRLQPEDAGIPAFSPRHALAFWASLPAGTRRQMTVRQGLFGTWQYDAEPLQQEVRAFHGRR